MDLVEPPPNDRQQRFHLISNPAVVIGNPAFDGFPNDEDFRIGSVTFDESVLVGGSGTAPITAMTLGIGAQPGNPAYINYGRWTDITTTVNQFVGTVDVVNNVPVAMDLTSTVTVTAAGGAISATGTFDVTGDQYAGCFCDAIAAAGVQRRNSRNGRCAADLKWTCGIRMRRFREQIRKEAMKHCRRSFREAARWTVRNGTSLR